jgi:hypothetical protein
VLPIYPRITSVEVITPYTLNLRFADGTGGQVDCSHLVLREDAGVFAALRDPQEFAKAYVHPEAYTVAWPGDLDLDPDVLYARAQSIPIPDLLQLPRQLHRRGWMGCGSGGILGG